jgi:hypothetical protein
MLFIAFLRRLVKNMTFLPWIFRRFDIYGLFISYILKKVLFLSVN